MGETLYELRNVPIFHVGTWNGDPYSEKDLDAMAQAYGSVGYKPPIKLGHDESQPLARNDGMPAVGWVTNLRRVGGKLLADFTHLPQRVYDAIRRRAYNRVSAEVYWDYKEQGKTFPRALKAVALLGADIPAVTSLESLDTLYGHRGQTVRRYQVAVNFQGDILEGLRRGLTAPPEPAPLPPQTPLEMLQVGSSRGPSPPAPIEPPRIGEPPGPSLVSAPLPSSAPPSAGSILDTLRGGTVPSAASASVLDQAEVEPMEGGPMTNVNPTTEAEQPGVDKGNVNYRQQTDAASVERCGACKFFCGPPDPDGDEDIIADCRVVEGEVASAWVCDLFDPREAYTAAAGKQQARTHQITDQPSPVDASGAAIEPRNGEFCVVRGSKTLQCFPLRDDAVSYIKSLGELGQAGEIPKPEGQQPNSSVLTKTPAGPGGQSDQVGEQSAGNGEEKVPSPDEAALGELIDGSLADLMGKLLDAMAARMKGAVQADQQDGADQAAQGGGGPPAVKPKPTQPPSQMMMAALGQIAKLYIIQKRGSKWVLISKSTGKVLGTHDSEADAMAQERAVQASKHGYGRDEMGGERWAVMRITREDIARVCPPCAQHMDFKNLRELKIPYSYTVGADGSVARRYEFGALAVFDYNQGLCDKFGDAAGFRTRCMESDLGQKTNDPGAFCNGLKEYCFGDVSAGEKKATMDQAARDTAADAKATGAAEGGQAGKEESDMTEREYAEKLSAAEARAREAEAKAAKAEAEAKTYAQQAAESAEAARQAGIDKFLSEVADGQTPQLLPVERPMARHLLDVLTATSGVAVKAYAHEGKSLTPADVFKRMIQARPKVAVFAEVSAGGATKNALPGKDGTARDRVYAKAKEYQAEQAARGAKVDIIAAIKHVRSQDPDLSQEMEHEDRTGARRQAQGEASAREYAVLSGQRGGQR